MTTTDTPRTDAIQCEAGILSANRCMNPAIFETSTGYKCCEYHTPQITKGKNREDVKPLTTDTPRTDAVPSNQPMLTAQSDPVKLYQQLTKVTVDFGKALDACEEYRNQLAASNAEVEFYKKSVKAWVDACEPIRGMADKLGLRLGECIIQHGVPLLLASHKKAEAEVEKIKQERNRIGVEIRGEYLPKLKQLEAEVERLMVRLEEAVEIAEDLQMVKGLHRYCNCRMCQKLDALKETLTPDPDFVAEIAAMKASLSSPSSL